MNLRKLKRELRDVAGTGAAATRERNGVRVVVGGHAFNVDEKAGWQERDLAQYIKSKVPVLTIMPPASKEAA